MSNDAGVVIIWREEGETSLAFLGEIYLGKVDPEPNGWGWFLSVFADDEDGPANSREAAKSALEGAVAEWMRRAGMVHLPEGYEVRPREATNEMRLRGSIEMNSHKILRSRFKSGSPDIWRAMFDAFVPAPPALKAAPHD